MSVFTEGYTDLEDGSRALSETIYEDIYPQRYPVNDRQPCSSTPYDIGVLHYVACTMAAAGRAC